MSPFHPVALTLLGLSVSARRWLFAALLLTTLLFALALLGATLAPGGIDGLDALLILLFALTLPWTALGFWNALIGLLLLRGCADPVAAVIPPPEACPDAGPIGARVALLGCIRNEDAAAVRQRLDLMIAALLAERATRGTAPDCELFVLSDSHWPDCIAAEAREFGALIERWRGQLAVHYRRRPDNPGYKAGNIRDFCLRWGAGFDYALVLDADSLMSAAALREMLDIMRARPRLGILQSLVAGLPTRAAFARPFQFGMRLGMYSYTLGSAWWQAGTGPYWGHNALIRLKPFIEHCALPKLPGHGPLSGWILSHDQVEAALMRRAGFEVRAMPIASGSWEMNPPTLIDFIRRDLRWCQGNMQYLKLWHWPGWHPVSRVQFALAILMFAASPAWVALMLLALPRLAPSATPAFAAAPGLALFGLVMLMVFAPKLATLIDALATRDGRRRFGGAPALMIGVALELLFSTLLAPIMAIAHTLFLAGLLGGRALRWEAQRRQLERVRLAEALARLWPQTLIGALAAGWFLLAGTPRMLWVSPFFLGALGAVPFAMLGSWPRLGDGLARLGLWRTPDEVDPDPLLRAWMSGPGGAPGSR